MCSIIHVFDLDIPSYFVLNLAALFIAGLILRHELKRNQYPRSFFWGLILVGAVGGMIGGKIYYVLQNWDDFIMNPRATLLGLSGSGWYGALLLGGAAVLLFLKWTRAPVLKTLDLVALVLPLGQAIGRIGCFLSGCCHGIPSDVPWALAFPDGSYPPYVKVHPTQLYESFIYSCVFILLWRLRSRRIKEGVRLGLYLILTGAGRFVVEFYRFNPKVLSWLTAPQIISFLGIVLGAFLVIRKKRSPSP